MLKAIQEAVRREPIGAAAIIVSSIAIVPTLIDFFGRYDLRHSFQCSQVSYDSPITVLETNYWYPVVAIFISCDFSNLDDQSISITDIMPIGITIGGERIALDEAHHRFTLSDQFQMVRGDEPRSLSQGQVLRFDDFILIPIARTWQDAHSDCRMLENMALVELRSAALSCLTELSAEKFREYIDKMDLPVGQGNHQFQDFALQITLQDGSRTEHNMQLDVLFETVPPSNPAQ